MDAINASPRATYARASLAELLNRGTRHWSRGVGHTVPLPSTSNVEALILSSELSDQVVIHYTSASLNGTVFPSRDTLPVPTLMVKAVNYAEDTEERTRGDGHSFGH